MSFTQLQHTPFGSATFLIRSCLCHRLSAQSHFFYKLDNYNPGTFHHAFGLAFVNKPADFFATAKLNLHVFYMEISAYHTEFLKNAT